MLLKLGTSRHFVHVGHVFPVVLEARVFETSDVTWSPLKFPLTAGLGVAWKKSRAMERSPRGPMYNGSTFMEGSTYDLHSQELPLAYCMGIGFPAHKF